MNSKRNCYTRTFLWLLRILLIISKQIFLTQTSSLQEISSSEGSRLFATNCLIGIDLQQLSFWWKPYQAVQLEIGLYFVHIMALFQNGLVWRWKFANLGFSGQWSDSLAQTVDWGVIVNVSGDDTSRWFPLAASRLSPVCYPLLSIASHCYPLFPTAIHCYPLFPTAIHCYPLLSTAIHC